MIDLHMHTMYSDGTDNIEELLKKAESLKLKVISITDHESIVAYEELEKRPDLREKFSGKLIVGAELKAIYKRTNIEVLGYGFDYKKLRIHQVDTQQIQRDNLEYLKNVAEKYDLEFDKSIHININIPEQRWGSCVFAKEIIRYPENLEKLKKLGEISCDPITFYRYGESNEESIFYIDSSKYYKEMESVIEDIHNAGGLAFLAHGYAYPFKDINKELENILSSTNIDGLECKYPLFSNEQSEYAMKLCKKYNKYMSGGSDYHAKSKPSTEMGTGINNNLEIDEEFIKDWINKV